MLENLACVILQVCFCLTTHDCAVCVSVSLSLSRVVCDLFPLGITLYLSQQAVCSVKQKAQQILYCILCFSSFLFFSLRLLLQVFKVTAVCAVYSCLDCRSGPTTTRSISISLNVTYKQNQTTFLS